MVSISADYSEKTGLRFIIRCQQKTGLIPARIILRKNHAVVQP